MRVCSGDKINVPHFKTVFFFTTQKNLSTPITSNQSTLSTSERYVRRSLNIDNSFDRYIFFFLNIYTNI